MLGCAPVDVTEGPIEVVSTGTPWLIAELSGLDTISSLSPDHALITRECKALGAVGITVFTECGDAGPVRIRVRTFAPGDGILEDPVCGSGNGCVTAYIARHKHAANQAGSYMAEQGIEIGRDGLIHASWTYENEALRVHIGGQAAVSASGQLHV